MLQVLNITLDVAKYSSKQVDATEFVTVQGYKGQFLVFVSDKHGFAKGFSHKVIMKATVQPAQQWLHCLSIEVQKQFDFP